MEVLDHLLAEDLKLLLIPLYDDMPSSRRLELWSKSFPELHFNSAQPAQHLLSVPADFSSETRTPWIKSCVIQAFAGDPQLAARLAGLQDSDPLVENTLAWARTNGAKGKEKNMLSIIERVLILKTVSIFGDTPDYLLAEVADLLEEQQLPPEQTFITKGDPATCMYIIVNGEVRIHDADRTFNTLGAREIVGEMAVLDPAPRSAFVTTVTPTRLLKLDRTILFELIADRPDVAQGIIRVLAGRLRDVLASVGR
jgi:hypothetical protein